VKAPATLKGSFREVQELDFAGKMVAMKAGLKKNRTLWGATFLYG
jgi:hypothetical protein